jgi:N-acetylglucosaminyl-diphospho-decaprenol L-rhamnosyltransferase
MNDPLPYTGERFTPELTGELAYEHWHRYAFARRLVAGRRVLDAGCGEGYGAALMAEVAADVVGIDIDGTAVVHAENRYEDRANLAFEQGDIRALTKLPAGRFDVITCFGAIEHLDKPERMLACLERLLAPDGLLLVSTPDARRPADEGPPEDERPEFEITGPDFETLLAQAFPARRVYRQKLLFQSVLWDASMAGHDFVADTHGQRWRPGVDYAASGHLAVCARAQAHLPPLPALSLYGDASETVLRHHRELGRAHAATGATIAGLQAELAVLKGSRYERRRGVIGVVVVSHNNESTIARCLSAVRSDPMVSRVVVVDNASDDNTAGQVQAVNEVDKRVRFFRNRMNRGFAMACNQGASALAEPWVCFVNPDVFIEHDTLSRLLAHAQERPGAGMLGVELVDQRGDVDPNSRRNDVSLRALLKAGGRRESLYAAPEHEALQRVDAISGALMLMPSNLFVKLGGFDESFRLHAEDLDLCRRVREGGYEVLVANDIRALHVGGVSSRSKPFWVGWQKRRSLWRYFNKWEAEHTPAWMKPVLWCGLWFNFFAGLVRRQVMGDY